ncbi:MAG: hypothetical protein ABIR26_12115 [Ramlibacter sp.]
MLKKSLIALAILLSAATLAQAQSTPAKRELIARILKAQQPGIEAMAQGLVEQPAAELMGNAGEALPNRVPKERQEAVGKEIQADVQRFVEETTPMVRDRAIKLAPLTIGTMLDERFSEDELKQIVAIIESPLYGKFQRMGDEMQKALIEKVVADTRSSVEPKVLALEQTLARRLGVTGAAPAAPAAGPARTPAAPPARAPARPASR